MIIDCETALECIRDESATYEGYTVPNPSTGIMYGILTRHDEHRVDHFHLTGDTLETIRAYEFYGASAEYALAYCRDN